MIRLYVILLLYQNIPLVILILVILHDIVFIMNIEIIKMTFFIRSMKSFERTMLGIINGSRRSIDDYYGA